MRYTVKAEFNIFADSDSEAKEQALEWASRFEELKDNCCSVTEISKREFGKMKEAQIIFPPSGIELYLEERGFSIYDFEREVGGDTTTLFADTLYIDLFDIDFFELADESICSDPVVIDGKTYRFACATAEGKKMVNYRKVCPYCHDEFETDREDQKFCNWKCRENYYNPEDPYVERGIKRSDFF